jgi:putative DNA primase/helicase
MSATATRPLPIPPIPAPGSLPATLETSDRLICWRYVWKVKADGTQKLDKPPVNPERGYAIDAHNPDHWMPMERARQLAIQHGRGIGIVLDGSEVADGLTLVGADRDHCLNPETGELTPEASALVMAWPSYVEVSPSGTGLRFIGLANLPGDGRKRGPREIYQRGRYLTLTGQHVAGTPFDVLPVQDAAGQWWNDLAPAPGERAERQDRPRTRASTLDAETVIARIRASQQGTKFDRLMAGDMSEYGNDHSSADIGLCNILAGWCDDDPDLMDTIFRQSQLMRDKWDDRRGQSTYGRDTILDALGYVTWRYEWHPPTFTNSQEHEAEPDQRDMPPGDRASVTDLEQQVAYLTRELEFCRKAHARKDARIAELQQTVVDQAAIICGVQDTLANKNLGSYATTAAALAFYLGTTRDSYERDSGVDVETGEILTETVPLRRPDGFVRINLGNPRRDHDPEVDGPWTPPRYSLAGRAGISPKTAGTHVHKLAEMGLIELDQSCPTELWGRVAGASGDQRSTVVDGLRVFGAAGHHDAVPKHGATERFKSIPKRCPQCGGKHLSVHCDTCDWSMTLEASRHHDGTEPPTVDITSIDRHHDGTPSAGHQEARPSRHDDGTAQADQRVRPGDRVETPRGPGRAEQVWIGLVTVALDSDPDRLARFGPEDVRRASSDAPFTPGATGPALRLWSIASD